jgi:hypothetical protein
MNRLRFNSGAFNSRTVIQAIAFATITASAAVSADLSYVHRSAGAINGAATLSVSPTRIDAIAASIVGNAYAGGYADHQLAAASNFGGSAQVLGYVLRSTNSGADLGGSADMVVIPAADFGYADFSGGSDFAGEATRDQRSHAAVVGTVLYAADSVVYRMAEAPCLGSVAFRVEPTVNGVHYSYADLQAVAALAGAGLVTKVASAEAVVEAFCAPTVTYRHRALVNAFATVDFTAAAELGKDSLASMLGQADLGAELTYIHPSAALIDARSVVQASVRQRHAGAVQIASSATVDALAANRWSGSAAGQGRAELTSVATYQHRGVISAIARAEVTVAPVQEHTSEADFDATASASAVSVVEYAIEAGAVCQAQLVASAQLVDSQLGAAWIEPDAFFVPVGALVAAADGESQIVASVDVVANLLHVHMSGSDLAGIATVVTDPEVKPSLFADAEVFGWVEIVAAAMQIHASGSDFAGIAVVVSDPEVKPSLFADAEVFGSVAMEARAFFTRVVIGLVHGGFNKAQFNALQYNYGLWLDRAIDFPDDPPERTFIRPASTRLFERPEGMRVFRRIP